MLHIAEIIRHEDFNYTTLVNDIALLKTGTYFAAARIAKFFILIMGGQSGTVPFFSIGFLRADLVDSCQKVRLSATIKVFFCCSVEQVDLFAFPPVCLPLQGQDFARMDGIVAGGKNIVFFIF